MKTSIIPATFLTAGLVLAVFLRSDAPESESAPALLADSLQDIRANDQKGERLEEVRQAVRRFSGELRRAKSAVLAGTTSLPEAADAVVEAARRDNPFFREWLAGRFPGLPPREQVIRLMLDHLTLNKDQGHLSRQEREQLARLRREHPETRTPRP